MSIVTSTFLSRAAAAVAVDVGVLTTLTPKLAVRLYGMPETEATGGARFALRLFGVRNIMIGSAALAGNEQARTMVLAMQVPDQLIIWHALLTGYVPRKSAFLALLTSTTVLSLAAAGYAAEQSEEEGELGASEWETEEPTPAWAGETGEGGLGG